MTPRVWTSLACCALLTIAGCGSKAAAIPTPVPKKPTPTPTATIVPSDLVTPQAFTPTPTPTPLPSPTPLTSHPTPRPSATSALPAQTVTPTPVPQPPTPQPERVIAAALRPNTVAAGGALTAAVTTSGPVARAEMYLGSGLPNAPAPVTYPLAKSSPGTWTGNGQAPTVPGVYHFTVGLYNAAGARMVVDNDGWNIQVTGSSAPTPAAAQSLPATIPLAPPFSYGNPVPAVFSAEGKTVTGSEVVSTTLPNVTPDTVAQFYTTHLPRAGWTVDQSTIPAAGAPSFSIAATSTGDPSVCVVQYSDSTVHIFYGTLPVG